MDGLYVWSYFNLCRRRSCSFWIWKLAEAGIIQLRVIPATGAEKFAEFIYNKLNNFVQAETKSRVRVTQVEFMEHGKNTAIYGE